MPTCEACGAEFAEGEEHKCSTGASEGEQPAEKQEDKPEEQASQA